MDHQEVRKIINDLLRDEGFNGLELIPEYITEVARNEGLSQDEEESFKDNVHFYLQEEIIRLLRSKGLFVSSSILSALNGS